MNLTDNKHADLSTREMAADESFLEREYQSSPRSLHSESRQYVDLDPPSLYARVQGRSRSTEQRFPDLT